MAEESITITPARFLGPITALVVFEERGTDRLTVTQHPVEQGAAITDHAYKEPSEVQIRAGATNASTDAGGDKSYVTTLYQQILALQQTREPFQIQTGKRLYDNMLITSIELTTDEKTEAALMLIVLCREIIIVQTQSVPVPLAANQANPQNTAAVSTTGTKQAQPSNATVPARSEADLAANG